MKQKLLLGLLMFFALSSIAQQRTVTGVITDDKGVPLSGVSVTIKGTTTGTTTAADGTFSLSVPAAGRLIVSSVGYSTTEINVGTKNALDIILTSENQVLTDVVVVGYGTARKKDLTGSVASVKAKDFNKGVINSPDQLLQNKVAGLEVTNISGQPGAAATVQIRGNSSIRSSNNPLYVVDGVPLDGRTARPNLGNAFGNTPNSNPLLYINPNDIAQIDVLKDASAAAIYGSRGANGVIIITTKRGTSGNMKVEAGVNFGAFAGYMKRFEVLDAGEYRAALKKYNQPNTLDGGQDVDALKEITQNKLSQNYSLAFSGGNETGKFRASFLGSSTQGFLNKSSLDKYLASFGGNYKFLDNKLTLDFGLIAGNYGENLTSVSNNSGSTGNIISSALSWNPTQPLVTNGIYNFPANGSGNPLAFSAAYFDESSVNVFLGNISASYKLLENLQYKFLYGINSGNGNRKLNIEGWLQGFPGLSGQGNAANLNSKLTSQTFTHTLNYLANISQNFSIDALVGYEYYKTDYSGDGVSASGFNTNLTQGNRINIPYTSVFQNAKTQSPVFAFADPTAELQSYFGRATFNYLDKYLLTATLRADGSSKFGENNKYGYFPSVGVKWVAMNEEFMKQSNVFSNLALRASFGLTGNQEFPPGSSQEQFALTSFNNAPQVVNGNPNLKWESTQSIDVGVEFGFAKGRFYGSFDYYHKNTSDILFQTNAIQPAPSSVSFINLPDANLINKGYEIALGANVLTNNKLVWDVNVNLAHNDNRIENFTDPNTGLPLLVQTGTIDGQGVSGTLAQVLANNQVVNVFYLKPFQGFDANGNQQIGDDPAFSGNPNPTTLLGFSTFLKYNKLSFSLNMGGAFGFLIYNNTATSVTNISGIAQGRNIDKAAFESDENFSSGVGASTRFLENGNYFKLRNATFSYDFGSVGRYITNLTAFVGGSNLFVITKFTGFDPEVNIDKSNNNYPSRSIEYVPYPTPRTITFGLNLSL
jgi:TonB-dependent starch-binding outer membrane protein SusC